MKYIKCALNGLLPTGFLSCFVLAFSASPSGIHPFPLWHSPLPPLAFTPSPSGGRQGWGPCMALSTGEWYGLHLAGPHPHPPPAGVGKNHPHPCPLPQVGEGVHTGDGQAGSGDALGCPTPSPSGGGNAFSLSRLRERVRVRVLLPPAHLCSVPSGLYSFPLWGKAGMGAGHGPEYEQVK